MRLIYELIYSVLGSKFHLSGWLMYICAIWSFKAALCNFYLRLVVG